MPDTPPVSTPIQSNGFADLAKACEHTCETHSGTNASYTAMAVPDISLSALAASCGVTPKKLLATLQKTPTLPQGTTARKGRLFSLPDSQTIRHTFAYNNATRYKSMRVVAVSNFKGGVGKTSLTAHLAFASALDGYRVLMLDLDPQASLSGLFRQSAHHEWMTVYALLARDFIQHTTPPPRGLESAKTIRTQDLIRPTHCSGLDIIPADLSLSWAEFQIPVWRMQTPAWRLWEALQNALDTDDIANDYDVVFIDTPPALGYLTINGLTAADAIVVPVGAAITELTSTGRFFDMLATTFQSIEQADAAALQARGAMPLRFEWDALHVVLTRYQHPLQRTLANTLRATLAPYVAPHPARLSTVMSGLGQTAATVFDLDKRSVNAATYDRAYRGITAVYNDFKTMLDSIPAIHPLRTGDL